MRCNIYAEEITQRVELVRKGDFTGVRFYLHLPVSLATPPTKLGEQPGITQVQGPFVHRCDDDDSAAVTFWGKREFKAAMIRALQLIDNAEGPASQESIDRVSKEVNMLGTGAARRFSDEIRDGIRGITKSLRGAKFGPEDVEHDVRQAIRELNIVVAEVLR